VALLVLAVVVSVGYVYNYQARLDAEQARREAEGHYHAFKQEQEQRLRDTQAAVPTFLEAARYAVERRKFGDALPHLTVILEAAPDHADARLLKAQLLLVLQQFAGAAGELEQYLKLRPEDDKGQKLAELSRSARADRVADMFALSDVLREQKASLLADEVLRQARQLARSRKEVLQVCQRRIETAWPGLSGKFITGKGDFLALQLENCGDQVKDLKPLLDMPLTRLSINGCKEVRDLKPLQDMPLTSLSLAGTRVDDLAPLKDMKLTFLNMGGVPVKDLSPLQDMPLKTLLIPGCHGYTT